ncbi:hypothetical protein F66182_1487 [Fusarium sp. NRRL 66182]|nr:hypothetical protein F66182_1487 [Fusarium sp. NRRL 66182]
MVANPGISGSLALQSSSEALMTLNAAILDPEESTRDATVLAALVLQMHDTLSAISDGRKAHGIHRDGALALLLRRDGRSRNQKYHASLAGNLFHSKVSHCVKNRSSLLPSELEWLRSQVIPIIPITPSSLLDMIGLSITSLRGSLYDISPPRLHILRKQCDGLEVELQRWPEGIPHLWWPRKIRMGREMNSPSKIYNGTCYIYPSLQIANIWNTWRIYRLVLEELKLQLGDHPEFSSGIPATHKADVVRDHDGMTDIVHDICYSIPFYLGSLTQPRVLSDIEGPGVIFPSYHDLDPSDEGFLIFSASDYYASKLDHCRHVALNGPLHVINILSHVISLCSNRASFLRAQDVQTKWIAEQFLRALYLIIFEDGKNGETTHPQGRTRVLAERQVKQDQVIIGKLSFGERPHNTAAAPAPEPST